MRLRARAAGGSPSDPSRVNVTKDDVVVKDPGGRGILGHAESPSCWPMPRPLQRPLFCPLILVVLSPLFPERSLFSP